MNGTTSRETPKHVPHDYCNCLEQLIRIQTKQGIA